MWVHHNVANKPISGLLAVFFFKSNLIKYN